MFHLTFRTKHILLKKHFKHFEKVAAFQKGLNSKRALAHFKALIAAALFKSARTAPRSKPFRNTKVKKLPRAADIVSNGGRRLKSRSAASLS
jgi:hypothetical protein